ncbi:flagellar motor protein MotB [Marmoricola sp. URHB0036]|uniref:flagellar motor protein MotB n=1 Tax=Marmoricola sp. URHB0036 TaxID=1298863 RepID=UPI000409FD59|nr:flagellar motor protein MotB [Marmoricola sp. URHB0036]
MSAKRREVHEEHENHERWLVTYADMVTLLMVLFIVMFAMSVVDEKKFNMLKEGLAAGFGQPTSILSGSHTILEEPGTAITAPVAAADLAADVPEKNRTAVDEAVQKIESRAADRKRAAAEVEVKRLDEVRQKILAAARKAGLQDDISTRFDERGLVVSLVSRHVVFEPDVAELSPRGRKVVDVLAPVLKTLTDPLSIDGHTNQVKVKPKYFPTDWELSAARAVGVLRYLHSTWNLPNDRMTATAYGHEKPLVDPAKPGSQEINKRVDIVVQSPLPSETRSLMSGVLAAQHLPVGEKP